MRTTPRATPSTAQTPQPSQAAELATLTVTTSAPTTSTLAPPTVAPMPSSIPATAVIVQPQFRPTPTNAEHWQSQQIDRQPLEPARSYVAPQGTALFWFDPRTGQTLEIGTLLGTFTATATFTWRVGGQPALLVPYTINQSYGLTAISDALITRMHDAGYPDQVEAFVLVSDAIQPT